MRVYEVMNDRVTTVRPDTTTVAARALMNTIRSQANHRVPHRKAHLATGKW